MNNLPNFLGAGQSEPKFSTRDYWNRFDFAMLFVQARYKWKIQIANFDVKQRELTEEESLNIKICKAYFIMAIADRALKKSTHETQRRKSSTKIWGSLGQNKMGQMTDLEKWWSAEPKFRTIQASKEGMFGKRNSGQTSPDYWPNQNAT